MILEAAAIAIESTQNSCKEGARLSLQSARAPTDERVQLWHTRGEFCSWSLAGVRCCLIGLCRAQRRACKLCVGSIALSSCKLLSAFASQMQRSVCWVSAGPARQPGNT